jgi:hypothetical protein
MLFSVRRKAKVCLHRMCSDLFKPPESDARENLIFDPSRRYRDVLVFGFRLLVLSSGREATIRWCKR